MWNKLISIILLLIAVDFAGCNKEKEEIKPIAAVQNDHPTSSVTIKHHEPPPLDNAHPIKHLQDRLLTTDNTISASTWEPEPKTKEAPYTRHIQIPQSKTIYAEKIPQTVTVYADDQLEIPQNFTETVSKQPNISSTDPLETTPLPITQHDLITQEEAQPQINYPAASGRGM